MTGAFALDWAILAVSLFNTILLLWLGLTVFLNAEVRAWGIWLAAGGLLLGALFFISHSAILGHGLSPITPGLNFWWRVSWVPVAALPFAWYLVLLWYAGFWEHPAGARPNENRLRQRHQPWLWLACLAGLAMVGLLLFANPLPSFSQVAAYDLAASPSLAGVPFLILAYPAYTLLCIGLAVDAVRRPQPSGRFMGDLARSRARRWLISASLGLLAVGLLVGWAMVWIVRSMQQGALPAETVAIIGWFDLVIEALIAAAVLWLGQAVVRYEVFTGKTLPRRGLAQYWRSAVILAAGYGLVNAWSLTLQLRPIYSLLLSMLLVATFYALLGWRAYAERERLMQSLRPFVGRQSLYDEILVGEKNRPPGEGEEARRPFDALCAGILETRQACLAPLGALGPFTGPPLVYPPGSAWQLPDLSEVIAHPGSPGKPGSPSEIGIPLSPGSYGGMVFAVSLWSERGLIGVLLIGEKVSGGLYTQEEIEIARAVGEHLMDAEASVEMARRLVALQRQRLAQSQVLDQGTRRALHDEILPLVHTSLLSLAGPEAEPGEHVRSAIAVLEEIHRQLSDLLRAMPAKPAVQVSQVGFLGALRRTVETDAQEAFDEIAWEIQPEGERKLETLPAFVAEVLYFASREAVRNAARYGKPQGSGARLCISIGLKDSGSLAIAIEDNGGQFAASRLMHRPDRSGQGLALHSTMMDAISGAGEEKSSAGGAGQGLALHSTMMAVIGGTLVVESASGQHTRVILELPEAAL